MRFIVVLIAMLIERFFDWSHIRRWQWFEACQHYVIKKIPTCSPYIILAVSILPFALLVELINLGLHDSLYGFATYKTIVLTIRFTDFKTLSRSRTLPRPESSLEMLQFIALSLLMPFFDMRENPQRKKIRLIGIRIEKLANNIA